MPRAKGIGMRRAKKKKSELAPAAALAAVTSPAANALADASLSACDAPVVPAIVRKRVRRKAGAPRTTIRVACAPVDVACEQFDSTKKLLNEATRKYDMLHRLNEVRFAKLYAFDACGKSAAEIQKQLDKADKFQGEEDVAWDALVVAEQQHLRARADLLHADARLARSCAGMPDF